MAEDLPPARPFPGLLLSALAGYVDAVGYLLLGGLFVAFMSGNTTRFGVDLVRGEGAMSWATVILAFVAGAFVGSLLRDLAGPRLGLVVLLATEAGLLALAVATGGAAVPLAAAMGLQNLARQPVAGAQPGTTFVTGTLVGLGQALAAAIRGRANRALLLHAATWAALLLGTAAGALAAGGLGAAGALALAPGLVGMLTLAELLRLARPGRPGEPMP